MQGQKGSSAQEPAGVSKLAVDAFAWFLNVSSSVLIGACLALRLLIGAHHAPLGVPACMDVRGHALQSACVSISARSAVPMHLLMLQDHAHPPTPCPALTVFVNKVLMDPRQGFGFVFATSLCSLHFFASGGASCSFICFLQTPGRHASLACSTPLFPHQIA